MNRIINRNNLLIFSIILIAAFLRLWRIEDYMTFLGDEGRDVLIVREILHGNLTLLGPRASAGDFFLGPIYYYFMAPFLAITNYNPVGPAIMVALFGVATVYLVYKIGTEFFGKTAGLIAACLYAVSPVVITYSRSSWNPNLMPLFSLLSLYTSYKAITRKSPKLFIISGVLLGIAMQLHYLAFFLGGILFFYILIASILKVGNGKLTHLVKDYVYVLLGFLLGLAPFLLFEARHGFPNVKTIISFIFLSGNVASEGNSFTVIGDVFFRVFARLVASYPSPDLHIFYPAINLQAWYVLALALAIGSTFFTFRKLYRSYKARNDEMLKYLLITLWIGFGILFFGFYRKPIYDYYFGFMFPAPFLLVGDLFSYLLKKNAFVKVGTAAIFILLLYITLSHNPFRALPNRQYRQVEKISKFVLDKAENRPYNFAIITGGNSDHGYRYIFEINGKNPVTIENPQIDPDRKSVTDQLFVVCESVPCEPLGHSTWEVAGFGRADIADSWDVSVVKVYKLVHYKEK